MTNREEAIKRVAKELGISIGEVRSRLESGVFRGTAYMVDTTERVLELEAALKKIRDGNGPGCSHCECEDHRAPDCCANIPNAEEYFCPTCIAGSALQPKGE